MPRFPTSALAILALVAGLLSPGAASAADCDWVASWGRGDGYDDTRQGTDRRGIEASAVHDALEITGVGVTSPEYADAKARFTECYRRGYREGAAKARSFPDRVERIGRRIETWATLAWIDLSMRWTKARAPGGVLFWIEAAGSNVARNARTTPAPASASTPPPESHAGRAAGAGIAR